MGHKICQKTLSDNTQKSDQMKNTCVSHQGKRPKVIFLPLLVCRVYFIGWFLL